MAKGKKKRFAQKLLAMLLNAVDGAEVRPEIGEFAIRMEQKMIEHGAKPHGDENAWKTASMEHLLLRLDEEYREFRDAVAIGASREAVMREAADVANMAWMVAERHEPTDFTMQLKLASMGTVNK